MSEANEAPVSQGAPKDGMQTSSFKVTLIAMLVTPAVSFMLTLLVASGVISSDVAETVRTATTDFMWQVTAALTAAGFLVGGVYVYGRNQLSVEKEKTERAKVVGGPTL